MAGKTNPILPVANLRSRETNFSFIVKPEGKAYTFEQLYAVYAPPVYSWIQRFVPDVAMADQILVNTFLNIWTDRHELNHLQVNTLIFLIRISNKEIEKYIGKTVFQEGLNIVLKRMRHVGLHEGSTA